MGVTKVPVPLEDIPTGEIAESHTEGGCLTLVAGSEVEVGLYGLTDHDIPVLGLSAGSSRVTGRQLDTIGSGA